MPKSKASRAQRILDAAAQAFARHGFAAASLEAIARQAGVNKALLFYYYQNKEGLRQRLLHNLLEALQTGLAGLETPAEADLLEQLQQRPLEAKILWLAVLQEPAQRFWLERLAALLGKAPDREFLSLLLPPLAASWLEEKE